MSYPSRRLWQACAAQTKRQFSRIPRPARGAIHEQNGAVLLSSPLLPAETRNSQVVIDRTERVGAPRPASHAHKEGLDDK